MLSATAPIESSSHNTIIHPPPARAQMSMHTGFYKSINGGIVERPGYMAKGDGQISPPDTQTLTNILNGYTRVQ
jgi:hypothetical protein